MRTMILLTLLAATPAPRASAEPAPITSPERAAYAAFVRAVRDGDAAAIRKCFLVERETSAPALERAVDQLVTFRRFERLAGEKLGKAGAEWGFGTSDAALDARATATRTATVTDRTLTLAAPGLTLGMQCVGLDRSVILARVAPGEARLHLERNLPQSPADFAKPSFLFEIYPGPEMLKIFKAAADELEARRLADRAALKRWVDDRLKALDEALFAEWMKRATPGNQADTAAARQAVEEYVRACGAMDVPRIERAIVLTGPDGAAGLHARVDLTVTLQRLALASLAVRGQAVPLDDRPARTLANVGRARLCVEDGQARLWMFAPRTVEQVADLRVARGAFGLPPESCPVVVADGQWKVDAAALFRISGSAELTRQFDHARDVELAGMKDLLAKVERREITTFAEMTAEIQELQRHVDAMAEQRRLAAEEKRQAEFDAWRASDAGKREIAALTTPDTRLQFRIEALAGDADADELDVGTGRVSVSRTVALNGRAIARAKATQLPGGHDVVAVTLTESGGRVMGELTSRNVNRRLAIVLDGKVVTAPNINGEMGVGLMITVSNAEEADRIAKALDPVQPPKQ